MEKKFFAISPVDGIGVTADKKYIAVIGQGGSYFTITDDFGKEVSCIKCNCARIYGRNWQIIEETINVYPKVMWVSDESLEEAKQAGRKRVVFAQKLDKFIGWVNAKTIEEAENYLGISNWDLAWDIEVEKPTLEEICQKIVDLKAGTVSFMAKFAIENDGCDQYINELRQQLTVDDPEATRWKLGDEISDLIITIQQ